MEPHAGRRHGLLHPLLVAALVVAAGPPAAALVAAQILAGTFGYQPDR